MSMAMFNLLLGQLSIFFLVSLLDAYYFLRLLKHAYAYHKEMFVSLGLEPLGFGMFRYFTPRYTFIFMKFAFSRLASDDKKLLRFKLAYDISFLAFIVCAICIALNVILITIYYENMY